MTNGGMALRFKLTVTPTGQMSHFAGVYNASHRRAGK